MGAKHQAAHSYSDLRFERDGEVQCHSCEGMETKLKEQVKKEGKKTYPFFKDNSET